VLIGVSYRSRPQTRASTSSFLLPARRHRHQSDHHGPNPSGGAQTDPRRLFFENTDPLKLIREGADQVKRTLAAPGPARVPVDERRPEHAMVFAAAYAKHLKYFDLGGNEQGDWEEFFASDVSAQLAVIAIEDVAVYRSTVKELLHSLEDPDLPASGPRMISALGAVFDCIGTLARRIDVIKAQLPADQPLRATLGNLIRSS
jgi:hypothetical protein